MNGKLTKDEMFESIYRSCEEDVYRACLHLTMDEDLACEMTQQAFVNFYERFDTIEVECAKAYLISSAKHLLYNYYRKTSREWKPDENDEELQALEPTVESVEEQYFESVRRMMEKKLSDEILMDLRERHENWYEVIYRLFFLDMTHEEAAADLGITKDILYSRLHRAKLWIQKNYKENFEKVTGTA